MVYPPPQKTFLDVININDIIYGLKSLLRGEFLTATTYDT